MLCAHILERNAGWYQGHIGLVAYSDLRSIELYKADNSRIGEVCPGARLAVVPPDQILNCPQPKAKIPTGLKILKASNTYLPTHNWR